MAGSQVRFTPDGKVYIIDAISLLSDSEIPVNLWEEIKGEHPELQQYYTDYPDPEKENEPVADIEGWERIQDALFDHLLNKQI